MARGASPVVGCQVACLAVVTLLGGCLVGTEVRPGTPVHCLANRECPDGFVCRVEIELCVEVKSKDDRPPEFVGAPGLNRTVGRAGTEFILTFTIDEPVAISPVITLDVPEAPRVFTLSSQPPDDAAAQTYRASWTAGGDEPEAEPLAVLVELWDRQGNHATRNAGVIALDFTAPSIFGPDWALEEGQTAAKADDVLAYGASSELGLVVAGARLLDGGGTVLLADISAGVDLDLTGAAAQLVGEVSLAGVDLLPVAALVVELDLEDAVGNRVPGTLARTPPLAVDLDPPTGAAIVVNDDDASTFSVLVEVALTVDGAEQVMIPVGADVAEGSNTGRWLTPAGGFPTTLSVSLTPTPGAKTVTARFRDAAHHEVTAADAITLAADSVPPEITRFEVSPAEFANQRTLQVTLEATDNYGEVAYYLVTTIAGEPEAGDFVLTSPPVEIVLPDGDGSYPLFAWVRDAAGILASRVGPTVLLDRVPPTVDDLTIDTADPASSRILPITLSAGDLGYPTTGSGVARWLVREGATPPAPAELVLAAPPATVTVAGDGEASVYAWVVDAADNVSPTFGPVSIFVDTTAPVVDSFVVPAFAGADPVPVTLTGSDPGAPTTGSGVAGWLVTISSTVPAPAAFLGSAPTEWSLGGDGLHELFGWTIDAADNVSVSQRQTAIRGEFRVNATTAGGQGAPDVAMNEGGTVVVVWSDGGDSTIWARVVRPNAPASQELSVTDPGDGLADVAPAVGVSDSGEAVVVWERGSFGNRDIIGQRLDASGGRLGGTFVVNSDSDCDYFNPDVARNGAGAFVVVWQSNPASGYDGVLHRRYDSVGVAQGGHARVDTSGAFIDARTPAVATNQSGTYAVVWMTGALYIKGRLYAADGGALPDPAPSGELTVSTGAAVGLALPDVGIDASGLFVVCWTTDGGTNLNNVVARRFDAEGAPLTANPGTVHGTMEGAQGTCRVARHGSGPYVIAWAGNGAQTGQVDDAGIFFRRYSASGATLGEVLVNTTIAGTQDAPAVAFKASATPAEEHVVTVWQSADGDQGGVWARRY